MEGFPCHVKEFMSNKELYKGLIREQQDKIHFEVHSWGYKDDGFKESIKEETLNSGQDIEIIVIFKRLYFSTLAIGEKKIRKYNHPQLFKIQQRARIAKKLETKFQKELCHFQERRHDCFQPLWTDP